MKSLALSCVFFVGAEAMASGGRPNIGTGSAKAAPKVSAPKVENTDLSLSIPFAPRPAKLDGTLLGDVGFDPLGLSNLWDLNWLRAAELKHGRVGMLASFGFLFQVRDRALAHAVGSTRLREAPGIRARRPWRALGFARAQRGRRRASHCATGLSTA